MPNRLLIELAALELLLRLTPAQRRRFIAHFHRLQNHPTVHSDYRDKDAHERPVHVSIFDGFAISLRSTTGSMKPTSR